MTVKIVIPRGVFCFTASFSVAAFPQAWELRPGNKSARPAELALSSKKRSYVHRSPKAVKKIRGLS